MYNTLLHTYSKIDIVTDLRVSLLPGWITQLLKSQNQIWGPKHQPSAWSAVSCTWFTGIIISRMPFASRCPTATSLIPARKIGLQLSLLMPPRPVNVSIFKFPLYLPCLGGKKENISPVIKAQQELISVCCSV